MWALASVPFLSKFLIAQKLGVDSLQGNEFLSLGLLDSIGMSLVRTVVCASVLLL